ncbi:hypothetical protein ACTHPF_00040 [Paenibacillus sp. SAF-054]|uniref:hypothetical protein n=1 Tax=unclassified Paenibacillus TaxID=185978 RepID=UPI003F81FC60
MDEYKLDDAAKTCRLTKRTIRYHEEPGVFPAPEARAMAVSGSTAGSIATIIATIHDGVYL